MYKRIKHKKVPEFCVIEGDNVFMYFQNPKLKGTRIDVTMAFSLGLSIGSKEYHKIDNEKIVIN